MRINDPKLLDPNHGSVRGYICVHSPSGRRVEVRADTSFAARNQGAFQMKVKQLDVYAVLCRRRERGGRSSFHGCAVMRALFHHRQYPRDDCFFCGDLLPGIFWSAPVRPSPNTGLHAG
jgi:hypothetical protein